MAEANSVSAKVGNQSISLETGKLAKQADGSVVVRSGDSMVLVTAVSAKEPKPGLDFFPLTVDYQERLSAAGRIPGSFFRREGRLTERETLISRLIDRSLRPLFPEGYQNETQLIATVFSADPAYDTDVLALTGASFAMSVSDVPFPFQFAGVRVGRVGGQFVANPSETERDQSDIDVIMAANRDSIFMVEGGGKEVSENDMIEALLFGQRAIAPLLEAQEQLAKVVKREKRGFDKVPLAEGVAARVREVALEKVRAAYAQHDKHDRYGQLSQIKKDVVAELTAPGAPFEGKDKDVKTALEDLKYEYMRRMITHDGQRIGGRDTKTVRTISCEVGILPRAHGSALFTRGETQSIVTTTLGPIKEQDRIAILSDILGDEDHLGDMDFKVCGTAKGITSIQMDIKITGVDRQILTSALNQAREGRLHILGEMAKAIEKPRADISKYAPKITTIRIPVSRIKDVIGPGGKVIKDIIARTGATIDIEDDGSVAIASPNSEGVEQAIKMIRALTQEAEVGKTYLGTVRRIMEFGAFVEIFPGTDGLVHISDLASGRVKKVEDVLKEGDEVLVKVVSVDRSGKIRLSRKEALVEQGGGDGKHQAAPPAVPKA